MQEVQEVRLFGKVNKHTYVHLKIIMCKYWLLFGTEVQSNGHVIHWRVSIPVILKQRNMTIL